RVDEEAEPGAEADALPWAASAQAQPEVAGDVTDEGAPRWTASLHAPEGEEGAGTEAGAPHWTASLARPPDEAGEQPDAPPGWTAGLPSMAEEPTEPGLEWMADLSAPRAASTPGAESEPEAEIARGEIPDWLSEAAPKELEAEPAEPAGM